MNPGPRLALICQDTKTYTKSLAILQKYTVEQCHSHAPVTSHWVFLLSEMLFLVPLANSKLNFLVPLLGKIKLILPKESHSLEIFLGLRM